MFFEKNALFEIYISIHIQRRKQKHKQKMFSFKLITIILILTTSVCLLGNAKQNEKNSKKEEAIKVFDSLKSKMIDTFWTDLRVEVLEAMRKKYKKLTLNTTFNVQTSRLIFF